MKAIAAKAYVAMVPGAMSDPNTSFKQNVALGLW